ncbi:MAG: acyl-CoA synthetase [Galactobacter sp.]
MNVGLGTFPRRRAAVRPQDPAIEFEGTVRTFAEVAHRVNQVANALADRGIKHGDRVAYVGFNHPYLLETFFGANLLGATPVLVNPRLSPTEVDYILNDSGAKVVVYGAEQEKSARQLRLENERRWIAVETEAMEGDRHETFADFLASGSTAEVNADVADDDLALIMYTSGTTGRPKGAMLTHRNLTYQYFNALLSADVRSDEVHLAVAPLFHIAGLNMMTIPTFMMGGRLIIQRAFKAPKVLETIAQERVTSAFMVPAMLDSLAATEGFSETDLTSLRAVMVGGSPLPERSIRTWSDRDVKIMQGYGMTEAGPGVCLLESRDALAKAGTAGRSHFWTEVRLVDPATGEDVEDGQTGEVWASGPNVMKGYWNRQEATDAALQDGWYHTGDIAARDTDGFYSIKDRIKDMYISGGENVYPAEVENALLNVPGVTDAAVIGVPDERWGETGRAYVVVEDGYNDPAALRDGLSNRLARYKLPRDVVVVDELPRTTTGKIQKNVLRQQA